MNLQDVDQRHCTLAGLSYRRSTHNHLKWDACNCGYVSTGNLSSYARYLLCFDGRLIIARASVHWAWIFEETAPFELRGVTGLAAICEPVRSGLGRECCHWRNCSMHWDAVVRKYSTTGRGSLAMPGLARVSSFLLKILGMVRTQARFWWGFVVSHNLVQLEDAQIVVGLLSVLHKNLRYIHISFSSTSWHGWVTMSTNVVFESCLARIRYS